MDYRIRQTEFIDDAGPASRNGGPISLAAIMPQLCDRLGLSAEADLKEPAECMPRGRIPALNVVMFSPASISACA